ncbi:hypothetical protein HU200_006731 [Digitaria exilis]|uniref:Myb-like domain-containing protein n=1 Tax=Digitaria exilis TaxID=1010633 RepID=A0A835FNU9_9POAL|nr:hypothetical protein HU200_006731 [Digitaria exilis]CAB3488636.1 unnamed protein product [Digitaria exilis]
MSANNVGKPAAAPMSAGSSDPSPSSSAAAASPLPLLRQQQHPHAAAAGHLTPPSPASGGPAPPPPSPASAPREYRKGNWTLNETLILINAKRLDDDRRAGALAGHVHVHGLPGSSPTTPRSSEQRWKWVENYCWNHGCLRSQNQCNDKWDNLLRDYKKVRDYESRTAAFANAAALVVSSDAGGGGGPAPAPPATAPSYWTIDRHERKERNLPTNLAREVFDALTEVLYRRAARRGRGGAEIGVASTPPQLALPPPPPPPPPPATPSSPPKPLMLQPRPPPPPLLPRPTAVAPPATSVSAEELTGSSESGEEEDDEGSSEDGEQPEPKRRRLNRLGSSVVRSATVLARTLVACEEKRERRHREVLELEERRLRLEEQRTEVRRQGFAGLVSAVNSLSSAIHALVSDHRSGDSASR